LVLIATLKLQISTLKLQDEDSDSDSDDDDDGNKSNKQKNQNQQANPIQTQSWKSRQRHMEEGLGGEKLNDSVEEHGFDAIGGGASRGD